MAAIPIIDISDDNPSASSQLLAAAADNGFVFVRNSGTSAVDGADIQGMFDISRAFFHSPNVVKEECSIHSNKSGKNRGWLGMHAETLDPGKQKKGDFKEAFNFSSQDPPQPLSGPLATNRDQVVAFQDSCHRLCIRILRLFTAALDLPPTWFEERHDYARGPTGSILRMLYYPSFKRLRSCSTTQTAISRETDAVDTTVERQRWQDYDEEVDVRAGAHSDYGSITLLFQQRGQPGLEILNRDGSWASVPVDPAGDGEDLPILVNIGDLLSYWTNGLLKSTVHRVIFPKLAPDDPARDEDRYSMAYFCHPLDDAQLVPVPSRMVEERSGTLEAKNEVQKVKALGGGGNIATARDHLNTRLGATYGVKT